MGGGLPGVIDLSVCLSISLALIDRLGWKHIQHQQLQSEVTYSGSEERQISRRINGIVSNRKGQSQQTSDTQSNALFL
jgi:hypothetical protein